VQQCDGYSISGHLGDLFLGGSPSILQETHETLDEARRWLPFTSSSFISLLGQ